MTLLILTRTEGAATVVCTDGDIDIQSAPQLRDKISTLVRDGASHIVVDLDRTDFLDSSALGALVSANKELQAVGGSLKLVCTKQHVRKVFDITRVSEIIPYFSSVEAALAGG